MHEYLNRFLDMAEELRANPCIQLLNVVIYPAISERDIARVEDALGLLLCDDIKEFYLESNGLQLRWIHRQNPKFDPVKNCLKERGFDFLQPLEWYGPEDGCINILPLQLSFLDQNWGDIVWSYEDEGKTLSFGNATYDSLELMKRIKPFDLFSKSNAMVFLDKKSEGQPELFLSQDHFSDIESSRITDFSSYLEFLLHSWGLVKLRTVVYSEIQGHQMTKLNTPLSYWANEPRKELDTLYP